MSIGHDGGRDDEIAEAIIRLTDARGRQKTICPSEVAREVAGPDPANWRPLMEMVRSTAISLAKTGVVDIRKSGLAVDPDQFSGIFRIAIKAKCTV